MTTQTGKSHRHWHSLPWNTSKTFKQTSSI